jgi:hypothetical protein
MLKNQMRKYKRGEKYYLKFVGEENFYTREGIPTLREQIWKLEYEIKKDKKNSWFTKVKEKYSYKIESFLEDHIGGHKSMGKLTIYGYNAMHFGITYQTKKYGYICFRLPLRCFGRWYPLYFYLSPNATSWAATFMLGKKHDRDDWALARVRKARFGHNFDTDKYRQELREINNML